MVGEFFFLVWMQRLGLERDKEEKEEEEEKGELLGGIGWVWQDLDRLY